MTDFETAAEEKERLEDRFNKIKVYALKKYKELPIDFYPDIVDKYAFVKIQLIYQTVYLKTFDKELSQIECDKAKSDYIQTKGVYERDMSIVGELNEKKKNCSEIINSLTKKEYNYVDTFNKLFELLACLMFDEDTANRLRKNAGFSLILGDVEKYSEEELNKVYEMYGYTYHGKPKSNEGVKEKVRKDA